jgi:hypothetical protein
LIPNNIGVSDGIEIAHNMMQEILGEEDDIYEKAIEWCLQRTYRVKLSVSQSAQSAVYDNVVHPLKGLMWSAYRLVED